MRRLLLVSLAVASFFLAGCTITGRVAADRTPREPAGHLTAELTLRHEF